MLSRDSPSYDYMKSNIVKIDNIMYRVKNLEKAEAFYGNVLGLKKVWEDKERKQIGFQLGQGDTEIVIHSDPNIPNFDFSYLVENVEEFIEDREGQGLKLVFGPVDIRCGKYALLEDPDGNKIPILDLIRFDGRPRYDSVGTVPT